MAGGVNGAWRGVGHLGRGGERAFLAGTSPSACGAERASGGRAVLGLQRSGFHGTARSGVGLVWEPEGAMLLRRSPVCCRFGGLRGQRVPIGSPLPNRPLEQSVPEPEIITAEIAPEGEVNFRPTRRSPPAVGRCWCCFFWLPGRSGSRCCCGAPVSRDSGRSILFLLVLVQTALVVVLVIVFARWFLERIGAATANVLRSLDLRVSGTLKEAA